MSIQSRLLLLVLVTLLPLIALAGWQLWHRLSVERSTVELAVHDRVKLLGAAIDREVSNVQRALQILATSPDLQSADFAALHGHLRAAVQLEGIGIVLLDLSGQQLVNTNRPYGETLPRRTELETMRRVIETGRPQISDLVTGAVLQRPILSVEVPVMREGQVAYVLAMGLLPERLSEVLGEQNLPEGWTVGVFDRNARIVARSHAIERHIGEPAAPILREAFARPPAGFIASVTRDGVSVYSTFSRSPITGWTVAIGVPRDDIDGPMRRSFAWSLALGMVLLVASMLASRAVAGMIARPVESLADAALALGDGRPMRRPERGIAEVDRVADALATTRALLEERARERDEAETALQRSEEQLRLAVEATELGTWDYDLVSGVQTWSERARAMHGLPPTGDIDFRTFLGTVHPDDRARVRMAAKRGFDAGGTGTIDVEYRAPTGGRFFTAKGRATFEDGRMVRVTGTVHDITELKRVQEELRQLNATLEQRVEERTRELIASQARVRAVFENSPDWLSFQRVLPDGNVIFEDVNPACERVYGKTRAELVGQPIDVVLGPEQVEQPRQAARACVETGTPQRYTARRVIGEQTYTVDVMAVPIPVGEGRLFMTARDLTERDMLEDRLRQAQKMEAVGQLTGGVAHDFNNLLAAILGNLELAQARVQDERLQRLLAGAIRAAERGAKLNEQLLAFSRKQHLQVRAVDANELLRGMRDMLVRTIGSLVRIDLTLERDLWPSAVDATQLELSILNLAINARDAMPLGGSLLIQTRNVANREELPDELADGDWIAIAVTDTGTGMTADVKAKAFEPFFTTKGPSKGSGLGLSQVYGFAHQAGGAAAIESAAGQGTTVRLFLPRAEVSADAPSRAATAMVGDARLDAAVLLVDDDEGVREFTAACLREFGCSVIEASSGRGAVDVLERDEKIDLLLVDFAMPGKNGAEVARIARARRPGIAVLCMTGYAADSTALDEAFRPEEILKKPFKVTELNTRLRRALRRRGDASNVVKLRPS